jgi:hypothetical protein
MEGTVKRGIQFAVIIGCLALVAGCDLQVQHLSNGEQANGKVLFSTGKVSTAASSQSATFGTKTVTINVPAGTCDGHWFVEGYKGAYPSQWNQQAVLHPEAHAKHIRMKMLPPDESRAQLVGPQLRKDATSANYNCETTSFLQGKEAGEHDAEQGIYNLTRG